MSNAGNTFTSAAETVSLRPTLLFTSKWTSNPLGARCSFKLDTKEGTNLSLLEELTLRSMREEIQTTVDNFLAATARTGLYPFFDDEIVSSLLFEDAKHSAHDTEFEVELKSDGNAFAREPKENTSIWTIG